MMVMSSNVPKESYTVGAIYEKQYHIIYGKGDYHNKIMK
jgi:hypothetical protein